MPWIILAIAFWGFFHSFNASFGAKDLYRRRLGGGFMKFYRLAYNSFAVLTFLPIVILFIIRPGEILYRVPVPWSFIMVAGQMVFASCLIVAVFQFGILYFIGLRQLVDQPGDRELVTSGLYSHVRHPFYTFFLLFLWLTPIMTSSLLVVYLGLTIYIRIGIHFEERKLLREFGEQYAAYRAVTPMLFPTPKFVRNNWLARIVLKPHSPDKV
jgi:protein-S-isoprenylcysteine O-methyltransferase Ste14